MGERQCGVCRGNQSFTRQVENLWFTVFTLPILMIEEKARYYRCENCLNAFAGEDVEQPSHVSLTKMMIIYLLMGYEQDQHEELASEISLKVCGFDLNRDEFRSLRHQIATGGLEMVEIVRRFAPVMNSLGKQQVVEAAFLTTYVCCDLQFEDRVRVNLIGNAMDVGLEFVEYCISQVRGKQYYGVRRLNIAETAVR